MNESAGIAGLPASNMESMDMAGGGIVAFADRGLVEGEPLTPDQIQQMITRGSVRRSEEDIKKAQEEQRNFGMSPRMKAAMAAEAGAPHPSSAPAPTAEQTAAFIGNLNPPTTGGVQFDPTAGGTYKPGGSAPAAKKSGIAAVLGAEEADKSPAQQDYLAKLAGVADKTRSGIAGLKNEAQSQILLDAMSALMGSRNLAEAGGKAGTLFAGRVGAMGKESRALEKEANDYDLNLAKYREAVESGDKDRALKLKELMETSKYHQAMIGKPDAGIAMLNALKNPENMEIYKNMMSVKTPKDVISKDKALAEWGDMLPAQKRAYGNDFNAFYNSVSSSTMGGGTGSLQAQAEAIKKSRGL